MSIFGSCLTKPGKYTGKPLIALLIRPNWPINRLSEITFKPRSYAIITNDGTTVVIISSINACNFQSCPLDTPRNPIWWLISKPYLHSEIPNWYSDISRAQLPKSTYSNSCVWPAGLAIV